MIDCYSAERFMITWREIERDETHTAVKARREVADKIARLMRQRTDRITVEPLAGGRRRT